MERLLTIAEVAEMLRLPVASLHNQRKRGAPPGALALKVGRHLRWRPEDLERWLDEQRELTRSEPLQ